MQEVPQDLFQTETLWCTDFWIFRRRQTSQVDVEIGLQRSVLVEIREHLVGVRVLFQQQIDPNVFGRQVANFLHERQLAAVNQLGNSLHHRGFVDAKWDLGDPERVARARLLRNLSNATQLDRARSRRIDFAKFFFGIGDVPARREIGTLNRVSGDQLVVLDFWIGQQLQKRVANLF